MLSCCFFKRLQIQKSGQNHRPRYGRKSSGISFLIRPVYTKRAPIHARGIEAKYHVLRKARPTDTKTTTTDPDGRAQTVYYYFTASRITFKNIPVNNWKLDKDYDIITRIPATSSSAYQVYATGIDKFIRSLDGGIKLRTTIAVNRYQDIINSIGYRSITAMAGITQISFRSAFKGIFNYNTGFILNYSRNRVTREQRALFKNHTVTNFLDLHFRCSDNWRITVNNERYYFNAINAGKKSYYFIDFSLFYDFLKSKLSFTLTGKNLMNNRKYISMYVSDYSFQIQRYDLIPAYLLLQINYRFR